MTATTKFAKESASLHDSDAPHFTLQIWSSPATKDVGKLEDLILWLAKHIPITGDLQKHVTDDVVKMGLVVTLDLVLVLPKVLSLPLARL